MLKGGVGERIYIGTNIYRNYYRGIWWGVYRDDCKDPYSTLSQAPVSRA